MQLFGYSAASVQQYSVSVGCGCCRHLFSTSYVERIVSDTGQTYRDISNTVRRYPSLLNRRKCSRCLLYVRNVPTAIKVMSSRTYGTIADCFGGDVSTYKHWRFSATWYFVTAEQIRFRYKANDQHANNNVHQKTGVVRRYRWSCSPPCKGLFFTVLNWTGLSSV